MAVLIVAQCAGPVCSVQLGVPGPSGWKYRLTGLRKGIRQELAGSGSRALAQAHAWLSPGPAATRTPSPAPEPISGQRVHQGPCMCPAGSVQLNICLLQHAPGWVLCIPVPSNLPHLQSCTCHAQESRAMASWRAHCSCGGRWRQHTTCRHVPVSLYLCVNSLRAHEHLCLSQFQSQKYQNQQRPTHLLLMNT